MIGSGTKATGGIYITLTATQEFVKQKLTGLGFTSRIVASHQQIIQKPPPPSTASCPARHPYAYRPSHNFDYCCASSKDLGGTSGANSRYPRSTRSESCQRSQYAPCKSAPCSDYKGCVPIGRIRDMAGTSRNADYNVWVKRCISLAGNKCSNGREWPNGSGGRCETMRESFVGGMKEGFTGKEGYAPLEGDMVTACQNSGTQGGSPVPGVAPTGNFLTENRKKEKTTFSKLQSMQKQVKNSINQMQSKNLNVNSLYKTKNTDLLKKLASYEQASHKLLKTGANLDTLGAQQSDSLLRKNSINMSYYLWLTLAISILGIAITKIK